MTYEVTVVNYNPQWIDQFEQEKERIQLALGDYDITVEHIGSTSIIKLPAKPIIDIAVGVNELSQAEMFIEPLLAIGYEYVPKEDFPARRFFRKGEWRKGTHHLHVYEIGSDEWLNNLLFRDYLTEHPETRRQYAQLKEKLAKQYPEDRITYTSLKGPFIQAVIETARKHIEQVD